MNDRNKEAIISYFAQGYYATVAAPEECDCFLEEGKKAVLGLWFRNAKKNYELLTLKDRQFMGEKNLKLVMNEECSPYNNMLLIFYKKQDDTISYKLVNGMAGRLFVLAEELLEKYPLL